MSALPKLFAPEDEPDMLDVRVLERDVAEGRRCVECHQEWATPATKVPAICSVCANAYLTTLLDKLGFHLRRDRGKNAEAHARVAREKQSNA